MSVLLPLFRGYLNNPKGTRETFTSDGWLRSGDVAYMDEEGFLHIVGRLKELIRYNTYQGMHSLITYLGKRLTSAGSASGRVGVCACRPPSNK